MSSRVTGYKHPKNQTPPTATIMFTAFHVTLRGARRETRVQISSLRSIDNPRRSGRALGSRLCGARVIAHAGDVAIAGARGKLLLRCVGAWSFRRPSFIHGGQT